MNRTIFFFNALERMRLLSAVISLFSLALSSISARKPLMQGTVLFINLLGRGLTPRACVADGGSICLAPDDYNYDNDVGNNQLQTRTPSRPELIKQSNTICASQT